MNNIYIYLLEFIERTLKAYRMPKGYKIEKPNYNYINAETLQAQVDDLIQDYATKYGLDLYNYAFRVNIKHNEVNNILRYVYTNLFKPAKPLYNNQNSLIDYDNMDQFKAVVDVFLNVCMFFNKALGLFSFGIFTGICWDTLNRWAGAEGEKLNPIRFELLKSIREYNKGALIGNLKDSPVGALAVANNDVDTGLEWSTKQALTAQNNAVFLIPSERLQRLSITAHDETETE